MEQVYVVNKVQGYIASPPQAPPEVVRLWQQALDRMKDDGSFAAMYARWLPGERPPGIKPDPDVWPSRQPK